MRSLLNALIDPVSKLLDKVVSDKDERDRLAHEISTLAESQMHEIALQQIEINKLDAASSNWFQNSWRPSVGWICSLSMAYHFLVQPILVFSLSAFGAEYDLPDFDMSSLMSVLFALLGLGAFRSYEKIRGVAK
jgi:hypothetical protein